MKSDVSMQAHCCCSWFRQWLHWMQFDYSTMHQKNKKGSAFFNDYEFNQNHCEAQGDSVCGPCFVLEPHTESDVVSLACDRDSWPEFFTTC